MRFGGKGHLSSLPFQDAALTEQNLGGTASEHFLMGCQHPSASFRRRSRFVPPHLALAASLALISTSVLGTGFSGTIQDNKAVSPLS